MSIFSRDGLSLFKNNRDKKSATNIFPKGSLKKNRLPNESKDGCKTRFLPKKNDKNETAFYDLSAP